MSAHDDLGIRMKEYEKSARNYLHKKIPVAIRIDGKAFHTFTKGFKRPFDDILINSMQETMKYLCEKIQGCVFGYTQSDEITLILIDYQNENSDSWFDYQVQKICSISASLATAKFNNVFKQNVEEFETKFYDSWVHSDEDSKYMESLHRAVENMAMFDSRCFNIPVEEVTNLVFWRQLDAERNSIQMVGQSNFSTNKLNKKTCLDIKNMLLSEKNINWDMFEEYKKHGSCCVKKHIKRTCPDGSLVLRTVWEIELNMPMLRGENRKYLDDLVCVGEWNKGERE